MTPIVRTMAVVAIPQVVATAATAAQSSPATPSAALDQLAPALIRESRQRPRGCGKCMSQSHRLDENKGADTMSSKHPSLTRLGQMPDEEITEHMPEVAGRTPTARGQTSSGSLPYSAQARSRRSDILQDCPRRCARSVQRRNTDQCSSGAGNPLMDGGPEPNAFVKRPRAGTTYTSHNEAPCQP